MERIKHKQALPQDPSTLEEERRNKIHRALRIRVPLIVRLAEKPITLEKVLSLTEGSVLEFTKSVEEPLDLMANNKVIGRGEAVKIGEKFGLKVKDIGSPRERIKNLGGGM